ncbi:MAG: 50S ribosomal protein L21e [Candidatus Aenigmarchaeota archaeon]|nr:50S ribosomal protein L21e [Candidatus Aenigmarchaeota archaeon]
MVLTSWGFRRKTRRRLSKGMRDKFTAEHFLKEFKAGDKVVIRQDAISQKGMPYPRYMGKIGTVKGMRGSAYVIDVRTGGSVNELQVRPEHLRKA